MTDRETVADWIGRYLRAWDSNDPDDVRDLFTGDAEYRFSPASPPASGHDAIVAAWLDHRDEAGDHDFRWDVVALDGDVAVVQGHTAYTAGADAGHEYENLWVIRFGPDARARSYTEWYERAGSEAEGSAG
jgi:ketosteroid isomerase-like protein